jgi:hypothetical protein
MKLKVNVNVNVKVNVNQNKNKKGNENLNANKKLMVILKIRKMTKSWILLFSSFLFFSLLFSSFLFFSLLCIEYNLIQRDHSYFCACLSVSITSLSVARSFVLRSHMTDINEGHGAFTVEGIVGRRSYFAAWSKI